MIGKHNPLRKPGSINRGLIPNRNYNRHVTYLQIQRINLRKQSHSQIFSS